jgi:hypothetical protein
MFRKIVFVLLCLWFIASMVYVACDYNKEMIEKNGGGWHYERDR